MVSIKVLLLISTTVNVVHSVYIKRHILESLSRKAVQIAKCRSSCLGSHLNLEGVCKDDCKICWDSCKKISDFYSHPDCNNQKGCETAKRVLVEQETKNRNNIKHLPTSLKSQPSLPTIKFSSKPVLTPTDCVMRWNQPEQTNVNYLPRSIQPAFPPMKIVFLLFGRDQGDRWYELGQTFLTQMTFLPMFMDKMSELRIMAVSTHGIMDVSTVDVTGCSTNQEANSEPFHSASSEIQADSKDRFFIPLLITCIFLTIACLAVITLLIKFMRKKSNSNILREDLPNLNNNNQLTKKSNVKTINTSIEIFEDDDSAPIYTIFSGKDYQGSSYKQEVIKEKKFQEEKLKAHVCFSKCGLGPEYLQYVHNTIL